MNKLAKTSKIPLSKPKRNVPTPKSSIDMSSKTSSVCSNRSQNYWNDLKKRPKTLWTTPPASKGQFQPKRPVISLNAPKPVTKPPQPAPKPPKPPKNNRLIVKVNEQMSILRRGLDSEEVIIKSTEKPKKKVSKKPGNKSKHSLKKPTTEKGDGKAKQGVSSTSKNYMDISNRKKVLEALSANKGYGLKKY